MENDSGKQTSDNPRTPDRKPTGYGKRPIWQWVVLYVIIAAIAYTLIYMLFMGNY